MPTAELMHAKVQSPVLPTAMPSETAKHGKRLTRLQITRILALSAAGMEGCAIAKEVGCDPSTVSRTLDQFVDGRELARKRLEGGAVRLAETVVRTKDAGVALKALGKLDVVRDDQATGNTNVLIAIGQPGQPSQPLSPPDISVLALSPALTMAVRAAQAEAKGPPSEGVSPAGVA